MTFSDPRAVDMFEHVATFRRYSMLDGREQSVFISFIVFVSCILSDSQILIVGLRTNAHFCYYVFRS